MKPETLEFLIEHFIKELGNLRFGINQLDRRQTEMEKRMSNLDALIQQDTTEIGDLQTVLSQGFETLSKKISDQDALILQLQNQKNDGNPPTQEMLDQLNTNNTTLATQIQGFRDFLLKVTAPTTPIEPATPAIPETAPSG